MSDSRHSPTDDTKLSRRALQASFTKYEAHVFSACCAMTERAALGRDRLAISRQILASVRLSDVPGRFWPR
jgi:hypothetical protein